MTDLCPICEGSGLRVVERANGLRVAEPCTCREERRLARMIEQAHIPQRYAHCTLESFEIDPVHPGDVNPTLERALLLAKKFVQAYPLETDGKGLLLTGSIGVGKTHLAAGILHALVRERGVKGLFLEYRDLLKQVQHSYNPSVDSTELGVLQPAFDAEVLVLDELGAQKPSIWVWDTVAHILNIRYNARRTTIVTTNFVNAGETDLSQWDLLPTAVRDAKLAMHVGTLGDRVGERVRSRLMEMCVEVEMYGEDLRQKVKRASFA